MEALPGAGRWMLIVDDEPDIVAALCSLFTGAGYRVASFVNPQSALQEVHEREFGLVLSDNIMPGMTGLSLLAHTMHLWPDTRRIMLTGYTDYGIAIQAFNTGIIHRFFQKPWDRRELTAEVEKEYKLFEEKKKEAQSILELQVTIGRRTSMLEEAAGIIRRTETELNGASAHRTVNRRLSVVVCGDVVGFSTLMSCADEATLDILIDYRSHIAILCQEFSGRVVNAVGDSILIEFVSVTDAVRCAIETRKLIAEKNARLPEERRLQFRFGINIGDVLAKGGDIYGNGVNVAARLQALADPGGICISEAAYEQVRGQFPLEVMPIGAQRLKNIPEPVRVYRVL